MLIKRLLVFVFDQQRQKAD